MSFFLKEKGFIPASQSFLISYKILFYLNIETLLGPLSQHGTRKGQHRKLSF